MGRSPAAAQVAKRKGASLLEYANLRRFSRFTLSSLFSLGIASMVLALAWSQPESISADGGFAGDLPAGGGVAWLVASSTGIPELIQSLKSRGCSPLALNIVQAGRWLTYVPGARDFVNAQFPNALGGGTIFAVTCATPVRSGAPPVGTDTCDAAREFSSPIDAEFKPGSYAGRGFKAVGDPRFGRHLGEDANPFYPTATASFEQAPVRASANGRLVWYRAASGYGHVAVIEHELPDAVVLRNADAQPVSTTRLLTIYGHIRFSQDAGGQALALREGQCVIAGQTLGFIDRDATNGDGEEHLHIGVRLMGASAAQAADPRYWFRGYEDATTFGRDFAAFSELIDVLGDETHSVPAVVRDAIERAYNAQGDRSRVGVAQNAIHRWAGANTPWTQDFDGGRDGKGAIVYNEFVGDAFWVHGGVFQAYVSAGGPKVLGPPKSPEITESTGAPRSRFNTVGRFTTFDGRGPGDSDDTAIDYILEGNAAGSAFVVAGAIYQFWRANGFAAGILGYPQSAEYVSDGLTRQDFEGGTVAWKPDTGAWLLTPSTAPSITGLALDPASPAPSTFTMTINGTGFDCRNAIDRVYVADRYIGSATLSGGQRSCTETRLIVEQRMTGAAPGDYEVAVRNGSDGRDSNRIPFSLAPVATGPLRLEVLRSLSPGSLADYPGNLVPYLVRVSGVDLSGDFASRIGRDALVVTPPRGEPFVSWGRPAGLPVDQVVVGISVGLESGRYGITLTLPDGRTASTAIDHRAQGTSNAPLGPFAIAFVAPYEPGYFASAPAGRDIYVFAISGVDWTSLTGKAIPDDGVVIYMPDGRQVISWGNGGVDPATNFWVTLAPEDPGGVYRVQVTLSDGRRASATFSRDSTQTTPPTAGAAADVVPVLSGAPPAVAPGQVAVQVRVGVLNRGGALTGSNYVLVRVYWSQDTRWDAGDAQLWESNGSLPDFPTSQLNAGGSPTVTATLSPIPAGSSGTYYLLAVADPTNFYAESNEANNIAFAPVVRSAPAAVVFGVTYRCHVAVTGWLNPTGDGATCGTIGQARAMEAFTTALVGAPAGISVRSQCHVAQRGWLPEVADGQTCGTTGLGLQLEATRIRLTGAPPGTHVQYRAHVADLGWLSWVCDGSTAGTTGQGRSLQALEVRIVSGACPQ